MTEAYPLWRELERASGTSLFQEVGLLCFGPKDGQYVAELGEALSSQRVDHDRLDYLGARERLPEFDFRPGEGAVFVQEAGWVRADAALRATYELARAAGVEHVPAEAENLDVFDRVVVCAGPWVRKFWPEAPVRVTLQATAQVVAPHGGPVWIEESPDLLYGFPSVDGRVKIGVHRPGSEVDPDEPLREPPEAMVGAIRGFAQRRMGIEEPQVVAASGCLYTVTADEGFLFHPLNERTLVVSACSGHGFKFGPWVGTKVAAMLS